MLHQAPRSFLFLFALSAIPALLGCSRQAEGERCSATNADSDCQDGLVCTELKENEVDTIHRCCPEAGEPLSDERCDLEVVVGNGSGIGGEGGMMSSEEDPVEIGSNCVYQRDCPVPLVCVLGGTCNYECADDRDCDDGETCNSDKSCVAD